MASPGDVLAQLPNPFTPMAFLPPDLAYQVTISIYVLVGSLAVLIWDILTNLHSDYKLLTKYRINLSCVVYFISRLSCLAYLLALVIMETAPVGNCNNIRLIQSIYPIAIPSTSLLFFFRVYALYDRNKYIVAFFSISWLAVVGGCLTPTQGISGANIGTTQYCINSRLESYVSAAGIIPFVNDTLVFIATTWGLMQNSYADRNISNGVKAMVFGRHLPAFSKALLQDGQAYYLTTISLNLIVAVMFYNTSIPIVYRSFIGVPNIVLMNNMACFVYRKVRFGIFKETTVMSTFNTLPSGGQARSTGIVFGTNTSVHLSDSIRGAKSEMDVVELDGMSSSATCTSRGEGKFKTSTSSPLVTSV